WASTAPVCCGFWRILTPNSLRIRRGNERRHQAAVARGRCRSPVRADAAGGGVRRIRAHLLRAGGLCGDIAPPIPRAALHLARPWRGPRRPPGGADAALARVPG